MIILQEWDETWERPEKYDIEVIAIDGGKMFTWILCGTEKALKNWYKNNLYEEEKNVQCCGQKVVLGLKNAFENWMLGNLAEAGKELKGTIIL